MAAKAVAATPAAPAKADAPATSIAGGAAAADATTTEKPKPADGEKPKDGDGETPKPADGEKPKAGDEVKPGEEAKPGDGKGGDKGTEGTDEGKPKAPAAYELTIPEGATELVSADDLEFIEEVARTNDWTNEEAQAGLEDLIERTQASIAKRSATWEAQTKADKTYGGDNFAETQKLARAAVNGLRPEGHPQRESFLRMLNASGVGNRLEVVAFLADLGKLMAEDAPAFGRSQAGGGGKKKAAHEVMYDHPDNARLEADAKS